MKDELYSRFKKCDSDSEEIYRGRLWIKDIAPLDVGLCKFK